MSEALLNQLRFVTPLFVEKLALDEVDAFLQVVETGSFTAAATPLGVSKSAVSRRVASLEEKLGVRLLERTTRTLRLTEAGQAFYSRVGRAMLDLGEAAESVRQLQDIPQGHLRVSVCPQASAAAIGAMLVAFREEYPGVSVEVVFSADEVDMMAESFDVALRSGVQPDSSLMSRRISGAPSVLLASPDYLRGRLRVERPEDLVAHECVLYRAAGEAERWSLSGPLGQVEVAVRGRLSTNDYTHLRELMEAGAGIGLLPEPLAFEALQSGRLVRVLPGWSSKQGELHVVYPSARFVSAKLRVFRDFTVDWLSKQLSPQQPELAVVG